MGGLAVLAGRKTEGYRKTRTSSGLDEGMDEATIKTPDICPQTVQLRPCHLRSVHICPFR